MGIPCSTPPAPLVEINTSRSKFLIPPHAHSPSPRRHTHRPPIPDPPRRPYSDPTYDRPPRRAQGPVYVPMAPPGGRRVYEPEEEYDEDMGMEAGYAGPRGGYGFPGGGAGGGGYGMGRPAMDMRPGVGGVGGGGRHASYGPPPQYAMPAPQAYPTQGFQGPQGVYVPQPQMPQRPLYQTPGMAGMAAQTFGNGGGGGGAPVRQNMAPTGSPVAAPFRPQRANQGAYAGEQEDQAWAPGDPWLDACTCKTACGCRRGERVVYRERRGDGTTSFGEVRYELKKNIGRECHRDDECEGRRRGEKNDQYDCRQMGEDVMRKLDQMDRRKGPGGRRRRPPPMGGVNGMPGMTGMPGAGNGMMGRPYGAPMGMQPQRGMVYPPQNPHSAMPGQMPQAYGMDAYGGEEEIPGYSREMQPLQGFGGMGQMGRMPNLPRRGFPSMGGARYGPEMDEMEDEERMARLQEQQIRRMQKGRKGRKRRGRHDYDEEDPILVSGGRDGGGRGAYGEEEGDPEEGWATEDDRPVDDPDVYDERGGSSQKQRPGAGGRKSSQRSGPGCRPQQQGRQSSHRSQRAGQDRQAHVEDEMEQ